MYFDDAPAEALLGTVAGDPNVAPGVWTKRMWMDPITENPAIGATELWEIYNATADAHPMHVHEVVFEVVNRQNIFVNEATQEVQVVPRLRCLFRPSRGRPATRTPSSPTPARSPGSKLSSRLPASSSGIATSSSTRTTR